MVDLTPESEDCEFSVFNPSVMWITVSAEAQWIEGQLIYLFVSQATKGSFTI